MIYIIGSRGIPARYGGFETLAQQLQKGLCTEGLEVVVLGTRDTEVSRSIAGRLVALSAFAFLETPLLTWAFRPKVTQEDVVIVLNPINVLTAKLLRRHGARVHLHLDGMEHLRRKWGRVARFAHRTARRIAANSDLELLVDSKAIGRIFMDEFGIPTTFVPYGGCEIAESDVGHRWTKNRSGYYLVVARPEPENNILEICNAFINSGSDLLLKVVGAPQHPTKYWRSIQELAEQHPAIQLLGSVWDRAMLCDLICNTAGYIHGHSVGGTNPILVDVLSHQTPTFAHDNPFNRELDEGQLTFWKSEFELAALLARHHESQVDVRQSNSLPTWSSVILTYLQLVSAR